MAKSPEPGFVHVLCNACGNNEVWLSCNSCGKSDHFQLATDGAIACDCSATYSHATCLCGTQVPPEGKLEFVPFDKGPMHLADLEVAWGRVAILSVIAIAALGGLGWWLIQ